jgi:integrase
VLNYRTNSGRERRYTIGRVGEWKVTAAREEGKRFKGQIRVNGADPVGRLQAGRAAATMADLAERYLEEHAPKKRRSTQVDDSAVFRNFVLPAFGKVKVADITFSDCDGLHRKITRAGKLHRANRVIALLSKAFNLSIRWGWRLDNPCKGIERNPEAKRTRYLSADELARLTEALSAYPDQQVSNIIRLLLLTGARSGEIIGARWDQFDLKKASGQARRDDKAKNRSPRPAIGPGTSAAHRAQGRHSRPRVRLCGSCGPA